MHVRRLAAASLAASVFVFGGTAGAQQYVVGSADLDRDGIVNRHDRDCDGDGIANARDPDLNHYNRVSVSRTSPRGDLDRHGIQNRHDRDRDGDRVRNVRDRRPNRFDVTCGPRSDLDGDGRRAATVVVRRA